MSTANVDEARRAVSDAIGSIWWLPLVRGILLIILGGYALFSPGMTMIVLTQVVGIFLIAEGMLAIVAAVMRETSSRGWTIFRGVLLILVGLFVFAHSAIVAGVTATFIMYLIATIAILSGILEIIVAIRTRKEIHGEGWMMLGGALAILFGVLLMSAPLAFSAMFVRILGAFAIMSGIALIVFAFRIRGFGKTLSE